MHVAFSVTLYLGLTLYWNTPNDVLESFFWLYRLNVWFSVLVLVFKPEIAMDMLPLLLKRVKRIACCWEAWVRCGFGITKSPLFLSVFGLFITFEKVLLSLMLHVAHKLLYQVFWCLWNSNQKSKHVLLCEWAGPVNTEPENGMAGAPLAVSSAKGKVQYRWLHVSAGTTCDSPKKFLQDKRSNYHFSVHSFFNTVFLRSSEKIL